MSEWGDNLRNLERHIESVLVYYQERNISTANVSLHIHPDTLKALSDAADELFLDQLPEPSVRGVLTRFAGMQLVADVMVLRGMAEVRIETNAPGNNAVWSL